MPVSLIEGPDARVKTGEETRRKESHGKGSASHPVVVRLKMANEDITVHDDILGDVTLAAAQVEDFVIQKSDGFPTYHFACVIDDALMKMTHVLRGQEHLMNTPKHIALQRALGFSTPRYAHLPVIFNMDGSKMSKRDKEKAIKKGLQPPEIDVHDFRTAGYLPEALLNFLSLLGWSPGDNREQFDLDELTSMFTIERVGKTNARFDREKLLAFNTDWAARLPEERLLEAFKDYLSVNPDLPQSLRQADDALMSQVLDACRGFRTFADIMTKAGFLFVEDEAIEYAPKAVKKVLAKSDNAGYDMLRTLQPKLESIADWSAESLDELVHTVCEENECNGPGRPADPRSRYRLDDQPLDRRHACTTRKESHTRAHQALPGNGVLGSARRHLAWSRSVDVQVISRSHVAVIGLSNLGDQLFR